MIFSKDQPCYLAGYEGMASLSKISQPCYLAGYEGMASPFKNNKVVIFCERRSLLLSKISTTLLSCGIRGDGFSFQKYHNLVILRDTRGWLPFQDNNLVILRDTRGWLLLSKISQPCYLAGKGMASPFKRYHNLVILRDTRGWLLLSKISQPCYLAGYEGMASPFKNIKPCYLAGYEGMAPFKISQGCYLAGYEGMASPFKNITTLLSCGIRGDGFSFQKYQNLVRGYELLLSKISQPCYLAGYKGWLLLSKISQPCYLAGYEGMAILSKISKPCYPAR